MMTLIDTEANSENSEMTLSDEKSTSFIVRIWREGGNTAKEQVDWRGSIEQVQSGEKTYFQDLRCIQTFMKPYIEALGIESLANFWDLMNESSIDPQTNGQRLDNNVTAKAPKTKPK
ncbi:hypothetical protein [Aliikangiella coralliicola]|uniref:Uncharacterized protein n=1 Tax=Aliikangiella coralliicola TaxID=2592383 RepID=A0A545U915_9GAMM|nr:hypothetical protein [Aliikangiella coralliicola]TQV85966.1 hypothetical protein FLL46_18815 [Aliikangiella coralliicola]